MQDPTEQTRREMIAFGEPEADAVEAIMQGEQRWTTEELERDFKVISFMAPYVVVQRRSDGAKGTLEFTHHPRMYFGWRPDNG